MARLVSILFLCVCLVALIDLAGGAIRIQDFNLTGQCDSIVPCPFLPQTNHLKGESNIWGLDVLLPLWEVHKIFDAESARRCFQGKKVLILGDSVMSELATDLALLLADTDPVSRSGLLNGHMTPGAFSVKSLSHPIGSETTINRTPSYRNMSITCEASKTEIWMRFSAHPRLDSNGFGLKTFFHPDFNPELERLLALEPDIVIFNSGLHDSEPPSQFEELLRPVADRLRALNAKVLFRGNNWLQKDPQSDKRIEGYDFSAKRLFEEKGMGFVNISHVIHQIFCNEEMQTSELRVVSDQMHYGAVMYMQNRGNSLIQTYITQAVLNELCPE